MPALSRRGSLLVVTLWVLLILSIFAAAVGLAVRQRLQVVGRLETRQKLRDISEAGVKRALEVLGRKLKPVVFDALRESWSANERELANVPLANGFFSVVYDSPEGLRYGMVDEERKINLNLVSSRHVLARLFEHGAGLADLEARALAASLLDWRDGDDHIRAGGAEDAYYESLHPPYRPKNADLDSLEELLLVKGVTPEIYARILPTCTLAGGGVVNLNTAPQAVLLALGMPERLARAVVDFRAGRDRLEGTRDDNVFTALSSAVEDLDRVTLLAQEDRQSFRELLESGAVDVRSRHFTIRSVARLKSRREQMGVTCVVERFGTVKRWQETVGLAQEAGRG